jgi:hypothetical protein
LESVPHHGDGTWRTSPLHPRRLLPS